MKWLKKLFARKPQMICGGTGCVAVCDRLGREMARLYFRRPESDEILTYVYEQQNAIVGKESKLRELQSINQDKQLNKMHEMLVHDFYLPWAEKIFIRSEGYLDGDKKSIDKTDAPEQFAILKRFYSHNLIDMTVAAFEREGSVKKKQ